MTFIKLTLTNRSIPERTSCKNSTKQAESCIVNMKSNSTKFSDPQRRDRCLRKCSPTREFAPMQILAATVSFVLSYCCYYFFFAVCLLDEVCNKKLHHFHDSCWLCKQTWCWDEAEAKRRLQRRRCIFVENPNDSDFLVGLLGAYIPVLSGLILTWSTISLA